MLVRPKLLGCLTLLLLLQLQLQLLHGADANDQRRTGNGKVTLRQRLQLDAADDFEKERDKTAGSKMLQQQEATTALEPHQLRHQQHWPDAPANVAAHHLRHHNKRQLAWEQRQTALRHHQHKSQAGKHLNLDVTTNSRYFERRAAAVDNGNEEMQLLVLENAANAVGAAADHDDNEDDVVQVLDNELSAQSNVGPIKSTVKRNHNNDNYRIIGNDNATATPMGFSDAQWQRIEAMHRHNKQQHQRQMQALRKKNAVITATVTGNHIAPHDGGDSSTNYDDADNIYSRNYITGTLTRHKVEQLGTAEAVKRTHHQRMQAGAHERALAREHLNKILKEAKCHVPQRYCERIQRDPSKIYTPHCTILYRCSEDSGCCQSRSQICAPKQTKSVELHFYVKSSNQRRAVTEKLTFVNHTECHCIERGKYETEGGANAPVLQRATLLNCNCPKLFEKILQEDGYCRCDCSSGNYGCDWLKRGSEHFSMNDRKCIQQGRCKTPTCEYGTYLEKHGRCPKQHEQPQSQSQLPSFNAMS